MTRDPFPTFRRAACALSRPALRFLRGLVTVLVIVAVVLAIPWTYLNLKWGHELQQRLETLHAQGQPFTMREAALKPIPDGGNAAVVYQQVLKVGFEPGQGGPPAAGLVDRERRLLGDYLQHPSPQLDAQVAPILARPEVASALPLLDEGSRRPACFFPLPWEKGPEILYPHLAKLRVWVLLLSVQAVYDSRHGRTGSGLRWLAAGERMSRHVASEPFLIQQLVAYAMQAILMDAARPVLCSAQTPPGEAAELRAALQSQDLSGQFHAAMRGEVASGMQLYADVRRHRWPITAILLADDWDRHDWLLRGLSMVYASPLGRPWMSRDECAYLDHMVQARDLAQAPYRDTHSQLEALERGRVHLPHYSWREPLAYVLRPSLQRAQQHRDEAQAEIALCRTVLDLKAFQSAHGHYPDTLGQLAQPLLEDPFSGQPFLYRREGQGFVLYSVGWDLKDDGGRPNVDTDGKPLESGDLVWRCER